MNEFEWAFERFESQMDRLLQDILTRQRWLLRYGSAWRPPTDVYETDEAVVIRVEIAGLRPEDVWVALHGRCLVISGYRQDPTPKVAYHQLEIHYGEFHVEVDLPWVLDADTAQAVYRDGFLNVILPKKPPLTIPVRTPRRLLVNKSEAGL
ncbi:MAG: Hsp20/alpha crystallin family protein [Anaerolineae bacterium]|nr:Hsp20/alpha crystallin family protein [Thermoflexus sp.]MDW8065561.1 Hsp20/alpha crystallin family protein [Anaerolineae bacterium]